MQIDGTSIEFVDNATTGYVMLTLHVPGAHYGFHPSTLTQTPEPDHREEITDQWIAHILHLDGAAVTEWPGHDDPPHSGWKIWCRRCHELKQQVEAITGERSAWTRREQDPPHGTTVVTALEAP